MSWFGKLISRGLEFLGDDLKLTKGYLQIVGRSVTINSVAVTPLIKDSAGDIVLCTGLTKPTDASDGYAKGCIFIDTDAATGVKGVYENTGTKDSCIFDLLGDIAASEITLADTKLLIGGADGLAHAFTLSQDATVSNGGVLTIAKINNLATAAEVNGVCDANTATAAEIIRACDVSLRVVSLTGTAAITEVLHEGKTCVITGTGAAYTYTLPEATGSGAIYKFIMNQVNTSNTIFTTADAANCSFFGSVNILDKDAAAQAAYAPAATDEIMTLNGTTTGGAIGDYIQFIDMATDKWCVFGQLQCPTGSNPATPFSGA
jgi:hypothetical protein